MTQIRLLDCTLRDGGFINNWQFGRGSIKSIIVRLIKARIELVELGFLDQGVEFDPNRTVFPDMQSIEGILDNIHFSGTNFVVMVDYGKFDIDRLIPADKSRISGIRLIFKKKDKVNALEYAKALVENGYNVYINPVSATSYEAEELKSLLVEICRLNPSGVSIVDTYGLMYDDDLEYYFKIFNEILPKHIAIGYHSHNNLQLAYSNSIHLIRICIDRKLIIDSSLYGMGKGCGNGNTELLALYLNRKKLSEYAIDQLLEAIDTDILKEFEKSKWGYSLSGYLAASGNCHPEYVKQLLNKRTLCVSQVKQIIEKLPISSRLTYDNEALERTLSLDSIKTIDDTDAMNKLAEELNGREILLLGPGASLSKERKSILSYITTARPIVISVNFVIESYPTDYVFISTSKRFSQFYDKIVDAYRNNKLICTSNVQDFDKKADYVLNYEPLKSEAKEISNNPLILLITLLEKYNISTIILAGFDGYESSRVAMNYYPEYQNFLYDTSDVEQRNRLLGGFLKSKDRLASISSITPTKYLD
jgi:4-hydroxy 2-oxovalerate aldolase